MEKVQRDSMLGVGQYLRFWKGSGQLRRRLMTAFNHTLFS